jgi:hypothetical protein
MSPVWQPPWLLQLFRPLQSCFAALASEELALDPSLLHPVTLVMVPATSPAIAAEMINVRAVRVINVFLRFLFVLSELCTAPAIHKLLFRPLEVTLLDGRANCKAYLTLHRPSDFFVPESP